ncbi:kinase [Cinnamomum micranthum f. kanehirae]|uniref:Kinase n=1 Tax=Cinnamomum micranthum f. kanehirae TaxID=337451 RepID=A0A3S3MKN7_9MAGN|nr:kinase [Cinnamomum micranthum f. kanehirae]
MQGEDARTHGKWGDKTHPCKERRGLRIHPDKSKQRRCNHSEGSSTDLRNGGRNCYDLSDVKKGNKYLIRIYFMYGNYDSKNGTLKFDL